MIFATTLYITTLCFGALLLALGLVGLLFGGFRKIEEERDITFTRSLALLRTGSLLVIGGCAVILASGAGA